MNAAEINASLALRSDAGHGGGSHGAESHSSSGSVPKNELRTLRGAEINVKIDDKGNRIVESLPRNAREDQVQTPYRNLMENKMQRFVDLRKRDAILYEDVLNHLPPSDAAMVRSLMKEVPGEHGHTATWGINQGELDRLLHSKDGLQTITMMIQRDADLTAAARGKFFTKGLTIDGRTLKISSADKLKANRDVWEFVHNDPNIQRYLREIWDIDTNDYQRNRIGNRFVGVGAMLRVLPRQAGETPGADQLQKSLADAYQVRELYYRDTLGYDGRLPASPLEDIIMFGKSHGLMGMKENFPDSNIDSRVTRLFKANRGGIVDMNGEPLEDRPGHRNPDFDNTRIDLQASLKNYFAAEGEVAQEMYEGYLSEKSVTEATAAEAKLDASLKGKASMEFKPDEAWQANRKRLEDQRTALDSERSAIPDLKDKSVQYEEGVRKLRDSANQMRYKFGIAGIAPGMISSDLDALVKADLARRELELRAPGPPTTPSMGPETELALVKGYRADLISSEVATRRAAITRPSISTEEMTRITEAATHVADSRFKGRISMLEAQIAESNRLSADLETLRSEYMTAAKENDTQLTEIVAMAPKNMTQLRNSYDQLISGAAGAITDEQLRTLPVSRLLVLVRNGPYGAPLDNPKAIETYRERIVQAKAEQLARVDDTREPFPAEYQRLYDHAVNGLLTGMSSMSSKRMGPIMNMLTPDDLLTLTEPQIEARLIQDYGWRPRRGADNIEAIAKMQRVARARLETRNKHYSELKTKELDRRIESLDRQINKPSEVAAEKKDRMKVVLALRSHQGEMMEKSDGMMHAIEQLVPDEYTDTDPIEADDPTYTAQEKHFVAPKGYYKILEYFGYNRNNSNMEERDTQLKEMQSTLSPMQLSELLYDNFPQLQAEVNRLGHRGDIEATLLALKGQAAIGNVAAEDWRGAVRRIINQLSQEANNME